MLANTTQYYPLELMCFFMLEVYLQNLVSIDLPHPLIEDEIGRLSTTIMNAL